MHHVRLEVGAVEGVADRRDPGRLELEAEGDVRLLRRVATRHVLLARFTGRQDWHGEAVFILSGAAAAHFEACGRLCEVMDWLVQRFDDVIEHARLI